MDALSRLLSMVALTENQKAIIVAYAGKCHPGKGAFDKGDLNYVINEGFIDRKQDHITDKGAAYVVAEMDYSFSKFIKTHANWLERRFSTGAKFRDMINYALGFFPSPELLDLFMKERYSTYLRHDLFDDHNAEQIPPPYLMKIVMGELLLNLLKSPSIDWRPVKKMLSEMDPSGSTEAIKNKDDLASYIRSYLNYAEESKG